jgi:hypothetical protein
MEPQIPVSQAMSLLRRQRHSLLNHLQVVSGWLQLGQPDRARRYLDVLAQRLEAESEALRAAPPALGLAMLELNLRAETYGATIEWRWQASPELADPGALSRAVEEALEAVARLSEGARRLVVDLGPEGVAVHTPSGGNEG